MVEAGSALKKDIKSFMTGRGVVNERCFFKKRKGGFASIIKFFSLSVRFDPMLERIRRLSLAVPCVSQKAARLLNKKRFREGSIHCSVFSCCSRCFNLLCS